jgi:hypothetical protein
MSGCKDCGRKVLTGRIEDCHHWIQVPMEAKRVSRKYGEERLNKEARKNEE